MDCSPSGSSVHGIFQARILEWVAIPFSRASSWPGMEPRSPALQAYSLPSEPPGNPKFWGGLFSNNRGTWAYYLIQPWLGNFEPWTGHSSSFHRITLYGVCFASFLMQILVVLNVWEIRENELTDKVHRMKKKRSVTVTVRKLFSSFFQFSLF